LVAYSSPTRGQKRKSARGAGLGADFGWEADLRSPVTDGPPLPSPPLSLGSVVLVPWAALRARDSSYIKSSGRQRSVVRLSSLPLRPPITNGSRQSEPRPCVCDCVCATLPSVTEIEMARCPAAHAALCSLALLLLLPGEFALSAPLCPRPFAFKQCALPFR
jgi:hypothetical protein